MHRRFVIILEIRIDQTIFINSHKLTLAANKIKLEAKNKKTTVGNREELGRHCYEFCI